MRVRRVMDERSGTTRRRAIVWFGSYGTNTDGTAKFVNPNDKHDNFSSENTMVRDCLIQRLSVIQHELWYNYQYGMPLVDEDTAKVTIDNFVMKTIQEHQDVLEITSFTSNLDKHNYHCDVQFTTKFGNTSLSF